MGAERGVGVGRDRIGDFLEQRDVVVRIAVEIAVLEVGPGLTQRGQPRLDAHDLAFAVARRAHATPRERRMRLAVDGFDFAGDQHVYAEGIGDRARDELVRRRDDAAQIALVLVLAHEFERDGDEGGPDDLMHELLVPGREFCARAVRERREDRLEIGMDVELATLVVGIEAIDVTQIAFGIDDAELHDEAAPFVVAVGRDERVIEVEECKVRHGAHFT